VKPCVNSNYKIYFCVLSCAGCPLEQDLFFPFVSVRCWPRDSVLSAVFSCSGRSGHSCLGFDGVSHSVALLYFTAPISARVAQSHFCRWSSVVVCVSAQAWIPGHGHPVVFPASRISAHGIFLPCTLQSRPLIVSS
jgi:hypothetical protein